LLLAVLLILLQNSKNNAEMEAQQQQIEQLQLQNEQIQLANEYENLNNEYAQYENQTALLANDSIVQKYAAARAQVEKLLNELNNQKNKSAAQIKQLKGEIETLKTILRSYVEQINELKQENQSLRTENEEVKAQNSQLSQTVQSVQATNQTLNERMTLAEKLNVTGVNLIALNKKGKQEKNVTKARQLEVTFTIPQNNSTPVGEKTIYVRITSPEGELLGNSGSFRFEGSSLQCTARKTIEYQGEEIGGIKIYWDVNATLNPGDYTVELFADNYRLASRRFTLKK
jgi:myosin heavy subunit